MKVLMINGSPRANGNTSIALNEMKTVFEKEGVDAEIVQVGSEAVRGCIACNRCAEIGKCVFDDVVNKLAVKLSEADGLVVASPVYYASANATLIAVLDRLFYSTSFDKTMKVGASVVCARRGGCSATFDELNKYFTISNMPIASSQYWNSIHGRGPGEAVGDAEGLQTMRVLARNMTFLMKSIELGKEKYGLPEKEEVVRTHFKGNYAMNRQKLVSQIRRYVPYNEQEEADKALILNWIEKNDDAFLRDNVVAHMTASAWVVDKDRSKVLMVYHNIYHSWSWLGGHADGETDLLAVAIREVKEEAGISDVRPVSEEIFSLESLTVDGHVKKGRYVSSHLHLNVTYLLEADSEEQVSVKADENSGVAWFTPEEALKKSTEPWFVERVYAKLVEKTKSWR